ncbi:MAG: porin family protein [Bacteroidota bacterium]
MKKIVIGAVFLLTFTTAFCQADYNIRFGLQLSPTFTWMQSDASTINRNGVNIGLKLAMLGEYYFAENYAVTSGLGFAFNHGGTLRYDQEPTDYWNNGDELARADLKYSVQYIEIPVGLKMRTREFGYLRYYGEPYIMFNFRSQSRGDIKGTDKNDIDIKEFVNPISMSWGIGVGAEYSISESTSLIGGLYLQNMFTDMTKDIERGDNSNSNLDGLILRLGVLF